MTTNFRPEFANDRPSFGNRLENCGAKVGDKRRDDQATSCGNLVNVGPVTTEIANCICVPS